MLSISRTKFDYVISWPRNRCCGVDSGWRSERKVGSLPESKEKKWLYSSSQRLDGQKVGKCDSVNVAAVSGTVCAGRKRSYIADTNGE
jgi:hypothetical protein